MDKNDIASLIIPFLATITLVLGAYYINNIPSNQNIQQSTPPVSSPTPVVIPSQTIQNNPASSPNFFINQRSQRELERETEGE